jgi:hypothetical protein
MMFFRALVLLLAATTPLVAQGGRLTGAQAPPPPAIGGRQTIFEQFASRLSLDGRTQQPAAEEIMATAAREAVPLMQEMQTLRIQMVNAEIARNAADITAAHDAYLVAATKVALMESRAFEKVIALLKANQQEHATEAFALLAGIFVPPPPTGRGARRGGGQ